MALLFGVETTYDEMMANRFYIPLERHFSAELATSMEVLTAIEPINNTNNYTMSGKEFMILIVLHAGVGIKTPLCAAAKKKKTTT